jgi:7-carboxy-7-deazaguanine synthase
LAIQLPTRLLPTLIESALHRMSYAVKELFFTLQGEGCNTGRAAVFCRFTGCNLWTGREQDRAKGPGGCSHWCDTDFVGTNGPGGGRFHEAKLLAEAARAAWRAPWEGRPLVVCTGGEPLLQLDDALIAAFHGIGFEVALETNGTLPVPPGVDWVCVSPKIGGSLLVRAGDEMKLVYPQEGLNPDELCHLDFKHFFLQPMDGLLRQRNTELALQYCLQHPRWRLSLQTHKYLGIP